MDSYFVESFKTCQIRDLFSVLIPFSQKVVLCVVDSLRVQHLTGYFTDQLDAKLRLLIGC